MSNDTDTNNKEKRHVWVIDEAVPEGKLMFMDEEQYNELFTIKTDKTPEQIQKILDKYNEKVGIKDKIIMVSTNPKEEKQELLINKHDPNIKYMAFGKQEKKDQK